MTQPKDPSGVALPLHFDAAGGWCLGWFHPACGRARDIAVVLCPPLGHEATCSYPTQVQLARFLSAAGLPVLRFDYHGTGDSDGDDRGDARVAAWLASVEAAVAQARACSGASRIALAGIRLGATLAVEAAARLGGVDRLLLWTPCPTGKALMRELRAAGSQDDGGNVQAFGSCYSAATVQDLMALDATRPAIAPARRALVIGRDDLPAEGPLPKALRQAGVDTRFEVLPGYAAMVDEPRAGVLAAETLRKLADWLADGVPWRDGPTSVPPLRAPQGMTQGVREALLQWPVGSGIHGVLTEPASPAADVLPGRTIVLLSVGGNYRVGPHRFYVTAARALAAAGHRVLRLDLPGIGDSPPAPGQAWGTLYEKNAVHDVRAALDALAGQGCSEFVLMGICSGSYVAFQTALVEPRVADVVLMNSRLLDWTPGEPGDTWQSSMQSYTKSTNWYRRAVLHPRVWWRVLRGEVHVALIARRFYDVAAARIKRLLWRKGQQGVAGAMQRLCRRGCGVLMLVSDADDGRDYVEFHLGAGGSRMKGHPNFRMAYVEQADHTFSRPGNQAVVLEQLLRHVALEPGTVDAARRARRADSTQPALVERDAVLP